MTPRSRPAATHTAPTRAPTRSPRQDHAGADLERRLAEALFAYALASAAAEVPGSGGGGTPVIEGASDAANSARSDLRNAKRRLERIRPVALAQLGRERVERIASAVHADGGRTIRRAVRAHVEARPYAAAAGMLLVEVISENDITAPDALAQVFAYAAWKGIEEQLLDKAYAANPNTLSESRTASNPDGPITSVTATSGRGFADLVKLAGYAGQQARAALAFALHLEERARAAQPRGQLVHPALLGQGGSVTEGASENENSGERDLDHAPSFSPDDLPEELRELLQREGITLDEPKADAPVEAPPTPLQQLPPTEQYAPAGVALPPPVTPPFVRSPMHGGAFMPAALAAPIPRAPREPPPDAQRRLELLRRQNELEERRRKGTP